MKDFIASELSNFLLKEEIEPESIMIEIRYPGTIARIYIDPAQINNVHDNEERQI